MTAKCTALETLVLHDVECTAESAAVLSRLIAAEKGLRDLDLKYSQITDELLYAAAEHCHQLEKLYLFEATGYTIAGVNQILNACQRICQVSVEEDGPAINAEVEELWQSRRPELQFVDDCATPDCWEFEPG
jgi:hypothetical protein